MSESTRIADQLKRAMEGSAWHGPALLELLDGCSAERAGARPVANAHSIWEIVLHVSAWHEAGRRRLLGEAVELTDEEDWPPVGPVSDDAWQHAVAALTASYRALHEQIHTMPDEHLSEPVPGRSYSFYVLLHGIVQHDLYHAGQIALLRK